VAEWDRRDRQDGLEGGRLDGRVRRDQLRLDADVHHGRKRAQRHRFHLVRELGAVLSDANSLDFAQTFVAGVGGRYPKPLLWQFLGETVNGVPQGYRPRTIEVLKFHRSQARIRIASSPARTSKSYAGAYDILPELLPDYEAVPGKAGRYRPVAPQAGRSTKLCWIVAPDYKTMKEFDYLWTELVHRQKSHNLPYKLGRHAYSPKQGNLEIELLWGKDREGDEIRTLVEGKSATNPESLQGEEVDLWAQSEAADQLEKVWSRYGATRARRAIFPSTPKLSGAWLKSMIDMAESVDHLPTCGVLCDAACPVMELGIESFSFTPHSNPSYDWVRYWQEHGLAESRVCGRRVTADRAHNCFDTATLCQAMRDPWFAEQFGGRWTFEADRVIPFKWMPMFPGDWCHVEHVAPEWLYQAKHFVAIDYGFTDPACVHWYAQGPDNRLCLYREIYESGLDVVELVERVVETSRRYGERIEFYVGDPQKPEVAKVYQRFGLPILSDRNKAATRDRAAGHTRLVSALSPDESGRPRLTVLSSKAGLGYGCDKTIQEWRTLRRRSGTNSSEYSAAAIVGEDHAFDCARYALSSIPDPRSARSDIDAEMRLARARAAKFRVVEKHTGALTGGTPGRLYAA